MGPSRNTFTRTALFVFTAISILSAGCIRVKQEKDTARLLKVENAPQADLIREVDRFARVNSLRAKVDVTFEDNSFSSFGLKEAFHTADGEVVVQRPGKISLTIQVPIIKSDIAKMTSDGEKFRVAILQDNAGGKFKKFVLGTNNADYSKLKKTLDKEEVVDKKTDKETVSAFANLRPQHFTDAMLVRPTDVANVYTRSTTFEIEEDETTQKKSPVRKVMRGYYLLDEYAKQEGGLQITRRFWFDRVGGIRLARQQIFDAQGEIESDIVYGREGKLTDTGNYANLPLEIQVTRPKEKYSMKLTYQTPEAVSIGKTYPEAAFVLQNTWNLEEFDLDKKLREAINAPKTELDNKVIKTFHE